MELAMGGLSARWNRIRGQLGVGDLMIDVAGKMLAAFGLGALLSAHVRAYAWGCVVVGLLLSVIVKCKYWKRFWS